MSEAAGEATPSGVRVQKVLSEAGVASRRASEKLIREGRVLINGKPAVLGSRIDPGKDRLTVDGERVQVDPSKVYLMLNKPAGVITTASDPQKRKTVLDIVGIEHRVFLVGRLDAMTEGLLLMTNDGELTHRLTHPSFEVGKTYVAEVEGLFGRGIIRRLTDTGVDMGGSEPFKVDSVRVLGSRKGAGARSVVELTVHEGSKHLVRRLLEAVHRPVVRLVRTGLGPLHLGKLASGSYRHLSRQEVDALYREVGL